MRNIKDIQKRLLVFMAFLIGLIFIVCARYAWVQLILGDSLAQRIKMQSGEQLLLQSPRGTILDRNGRELAVSMMTQSLLLIRIMCRMPTSSLVIWHR